MGKVTQLKFKEQKVDANLVRYDLGTGKGALCPEGFVGVDIRPAKGVEIVTDLRKRWPWKNESVDTLGANYLLQYFKPAERKHFINEAYRVLKKGGTLVLVTPYWAANKAFADVDCEWPPISESWFFFLDKNWREQQNYVIEGYECDFEHNLVYGMHHTVLPWNVERQQYAVAYFKEAAQDLHVTLTKR